MVFQCINICQVPRELLKTSAFGLSFQHLPRDLANVNEWKTMFDPYNGNALKLSIKHIEKHFPEMLLPRFLCLCH